MRIAIYTRPGAASSITRPHWDAALRRSALQSIGLSVRLCHSEDELASTIPDVDMVVSSRSDIRFVLTGAETHLKMVFVAFSGINHLAPFDWVPVGTPLVNNSGASRRAMGEYVAFALMLLANRLVWEKDPSFLSRATAGGFASLAGQRMTVIGTGGAGCGAAEMARHFRMPVTGVRRSGRPDPLFDHIYPARDIATALAEADHVVVACPLTPETTQLVDAALLARMKRGACIINIARGQVLHEPALCDAVDSGAIGGAILDVVTGADPGARIRNTRGILVTPHVSGDDAQHYISYTLDIFFANLQDLVQGRPPANSVDLALGY